MDDTNDIENQISNLNSKIREDLFQTNQLIKEGKEISSLMDEIWEFSKDKFRLEAERNNMLGKYDGIIFTIGFSPEPIILNILAMEPKCVYFIYTKESEKILNRIIKETKLKPSQYKREEMRRISAAESYNQVKEGIKFLSEQKKIRKNKIALDPTGGTKIMSVGCGIAASIFNLDILYVNNQKYNPELRRPEPGSEILINIPNPFDIYQDDKIIEGLNYLKILNFSHARTTFYKIKNSSSNPLLPKLLAVISDILYSWDMIDHGDAIKSVNKARKIITQMRTKLTPIRTKLLDLLDSWQSYLEEIHIQIKDSKKELEKISPLLIYDIKKNADREFNNLAYNNAALKYYRDIEMINQYILLENYNINTQEPAYTDIPQKTIDYLKENTEHQSTTNLPDIILNRYNEIWKKIYDKIYPEQEFKKREILPRKIGLVAGIIFRLILGDISIDFDFVIKTLQSVENRNSSIFAHGIESINKKNCERLKKINEKMIKEIEIDHVWKNKVFSYKDLERLSDLFFTIL